MSLMNYRWKLLFIIFYDGFVDCWDILDILFFQYLRFIDGLNWLQWIN